MTFEQRIAELRAFERETGQPLPMFPADILAWEDRGYVVDLCSGKVYDSVTVQPTPQAQAVAYLLADVEGVVTI